MIAPVILVTALLLAAKPSPDIFCIQSNNASACVIPRLNTMFGQLNRPGTLCTKPFWPPSVMSSVARRHRQTGHAGEDADLHPVDLEEEA